MCDTANLRAACAPRLGSIRALPSGCAGHGVKNRRQVSGHAPMNLTHHLFPGGVVKTVQCQTRRTQIAWISGLDRVIDGVAAHLVHVVGLVADLLEGLKKADVGRIGHRMGLSGRKTGIVYRGQS